LTLPNAEVRALCKRKGFLSASRFRSVFSQKDQNDLLSPGEFEKAGKGFDVSVYFKPNEDNLYKMHT
jgi:hypothetical protein